MVAHRRLGAALGSAMLAAERAELALVAGCGSMASWASSSLLMRPAEASALMSAARRAEALPGLGALFTSGWHGRAQLAIADRALAGMPADLAQQGEAFLLEHGKSLTVREFEVVAQELRETMVPALVADELDRLSEASELNVSHSPGGVRMSGTMNGIDAETVWEAINRAAEPLPDDHRTAAKRRADALALMARVFTGHQLTEADVQGTGYTPADLPPVQVQVIADVVTLQRAVDAAAEDAARRAGPASGTGHPGCAATGDATPGDGSRRLPAWIPASDSELVRGAVGETTRAPIGWRELTQSLCDAGIQRLILGPASEVLDLGRTARLFTRAQRRAMLRGKGSCSWPRCDSPWVEADHEIAWSQGGCTDIAHARALCGFHHRLVHRGWKLVPIDTVEGLDDTVDGLHDTGDPPAELTGGPPRRRGQPVLRAVPPPDWDLQLSRLRGRRRPLSVA